MQGCGVLDGTVIQAPAVKNSASAVENDWLGYELVRMDGRRKTRAGGEECRARHLQLLNDKGNIKTEPTAMEARQTVAFPAPDRPGPLRNGRRSPDRRERQDLQERPLVASMRTLGLLLPLPFGPTSTKVLLPLHDHVITPQLARSYCSFNSGDERRKFGSYDWAAVAA
jgi:hypothetical protein